jgi:alcohol dehydrogenase, propanol-preferring
MKAARLLQPGKGLVIQDVPTPAPQADQVLVKVEACGVCHTDVHLRKGGIGNLRNETIGMRYPVTMGHEIAGTVQELGDGVVGLSKGDRVLVDWVSGDGDCSYCKAGEECMCNKVRYLGVHLDGGYAEAVLVPHQRCIFRLGSLSPQEAAPLADAGVTAYSATRKASLGPDKVAVVIGVGGVGLMAVQFASKVDGSQVIAVGGRDDTLDAARVAGATHLVNSGRTDAAKEVMRLTGGKGADAILDMVCSEGTLKAYPGTLAKDGRYVMVGLYGGGIVAHAPIFTLRNQSFIGSNYGTRDDFRMVVELGEGAKVRASTSRTVKLESVNGALDDLEKDRAVGRTVVIP